MNYLKSAIAGFAMSFIGTALCGAKVGTGHYMGYYGKIQKHLYELIFNYDLTATPVQKLYRKYNLKFDTNKDGIIDRINWKDFKYDKYYNTYLKPTEKNYWFNKDDWSVAEAFLLNNLASIPISLLGALFHDKVGRDLTPQINEAFDIDISPYLVTGGVFGGAVAVVFGIGLLIGNEPRINDLTQPWIYSLSIIEGFVYGATAMAGAYFGDEDNDNANNDNSDFIEEVI